MPILILEAPSSLADASTAVWSFVQSDDGQTVSHSGQSAAALLPQPSKGWDVVLALPVQDISWHRVQLPQISLKDRTRLRAILQGLLEDQVLEDTAQLHFALEPGAVPGQACWVAVCHADKLQSHLTNLAAHGIAVRRIVPAIAPAQEGHTQTSPTATNIYVLGTAEAPWLVVNPAEDGGVLALPLTSAAATLHATERHPLSVQAEPAVYQLAQQYLGRSVELMESSQRLLRAAASPWDLAQFQFANSGRDKLAQHASASARALWHAPQWRWLRRGVVTLVLVQLLGVNVWAWQARQDLAQQRAQIRQIFTATFPQVPVVLDAPLQMRQELQRLQQRSGALTPAAFEVLAGDAGASLPAGVIPQEIRYEDGRLTLTGLTPNDTRMASWLAQLPQRGLHAQWQEGVLHLTPTQQGERP